MDEIYVWDDAMCQGVTSGTRTQVGCWAVVALPQDTRILDPGCNKVLRQCASLLPSHARFVLLVFQGVFSMKNT